MQQAPFLVLCNQMPREQEVQAEHSFSVSRAVLHYELKDPDGQRMLGIELGHLTAGPR